MCVYSCSVLRSISHRFHFAAGRTGKSFCSYKNHSLTFIFFKMPVTLALTIPSLNLWTTKRRSFSKMSARTLMTMREQTISSMQVVPMKPWKILSKSTLKSEVEHVSFLYLHICNHWHFFRAAHRAKFFWRLATHTISEKISKGDCEDPPIRFYRWEACYLW